MYLQVQCYEAKPLKLIGKHNVGHKNDTNDYIHTFSNLTPGGTYTVNVCAVSNKKRSVIVPQQRTLGVNILYAVHFTCSHE